MTEQELRQLCEQWGVTLRINVRKDRRTPAYEAVKWYAGKTRTVYLFAASRLPKTSTEAIEAKLSKLSEET
jgi:hypothetical protein